MTHISRRKFIGKASCGAMASTTMLSTLLNLKALNAAAMSDSVVQAADDYKALVCISLGGGNDAYNMLIPTSTREYNDYANVRASIAIPQNEILGLDTLNTPGRTFGLHPSMPNIRALYNQGKAAFVSNVGTLIEPISVQQFWDETKKAPLGLLSHSDQRQQWMTAVPHERAGIGWGGKIADMINQMNDTDGLSMNISLGGTNIFQTGVENIEYTLDPANPTDSPLKDINGYNENWAFNRIKKEAIDNMLDRTYSDIYENTYVNTIRGARDGWIRYKEALDGVTLNTTFEFATNEETGRHITYALGWVAKMIAARETLGYKRQTFFLDFSGWDHHDELLDAQSTMLRELDHAVHQFQLAMQELNTEDCVTSFLISDFARTLRFNGNGTDHAWGSNMMAIGGPVRGQRIYGTYPETLDPNQNEVDLGGGIIVPTTSADLYFAELAHWFGVSKSNLETIFPNLINFYDYRTDPNNPLNFLTI